MKFLKNIFIGISITGLLVNVLSCKEDFLDEELSTAYSTEYYETEEGLESLAVALYAAIRYHFAYEWAYGFTNYGTDEFSTGTDLTSEMWNTYDSRLAPTIVNAANANYPAPEYLWNHMYYGISSANILIQNSDYITDEDMHDKCLGEGYFLRAYNYLRLVEQFGGVALTLSPSTSVQRNWDRSSMEDCLKQIVSDFDSAYSLLPEDEWRGKGTWTKPLAAHMLAKTLLLRVSERNDDWNSSYITDDLKRIIDLANYVIEARPLASNYADLWDWTGVDCESEMLDEVLMSAQFNADESTAGRYQNKAFCYESAQYSNLTYMTRTVAGGLDFQRLRTTEFTCNVYDRENDSRFWKSFKTKYNVNSTKTDNAYGIEDGDLGIIYIVNNEDDDRFNVDSMGTESFYFTDTATGHKVPHAYINYAGGEWVGQEWGDNRYISLSKYEDGSRTAIKAWGNRDGILARTGETFLIKAEALVRQGLYPDAINVVNELRARAQYTAGELREHHVDGGQVAGGEDADYDAYTNKNSYYESNNIAYTTEASDLQIASYTELPEVDEEILTELKATSDYDRMLNFILNERTRELCGEYLRWVDLSRTETLVTRAYAFNPEVAEAANLDEHHELRPIPQSFIDGLTHEDGSSLSEEEQDALQNPGY